MRLAAAGLLVLLGGCQWLLGLDKFPERDAPGGAGSWAHVAAGRYFTCAIDLGSNLYCWGYNGDFELGTGGAFQRESPTLVGGGPWTQVTAGKVHACGIQGDGSLWCWGSNYVGQLGDGTTNDANQPRRIGTEQWKSVATYEATTCAIDMADQLFCWGDNTHGPVGVNSMTSYFDSPQAVKPGTTWAWVAPGSDHTCGLTTDQQVYCWGANWNGQVGNGTSGPDVLAPVAVAGTFVSIAAGFDFSCGVGTDGKIRCWGNNAWGQLGDGTTTSYDAPHAATTTITDFTTIRAGTTTTCALRQNGALYCWGDATPGPLTAAATGPTAVPAPSGAWTELAPGHTHFCGIGAVHDLWCAGDGSTGAIGNGTAGPRKPVKVASGIARVDASGNSTCAIDGSGTLQCWGANAGGQLGNGTLVRALAPTPVSSTETWTAVTLGDQHACGITAGNTTQCWGFHGTGIGVGGSVLVPTSVTPDPGFTSIAAGGDHTCGLTGAASNNVYCWGANDYGQLGVGGNTSPHETVTQVSSKTFAKIDAGYHFSCAIDSTGTLTCAGRNDSAQLANGLGSPMQTSFVASGDTTKYVSVIAGNGAACALDNASHIACWGRNGYGEAGSGQNPILLPTRLPGLWADIAIGQEFACGLLDNSTVECWGHNDYGQLGTGNLTDSRAMVMVAGLPGNINFVTAGDAHACALTSDFDLWCWGKNDDGQVGTDAGWVHSLFEVPSPQ